MNVVLLWYQNYVKNQFQLKAIAIVVAFAERQYKSGQWMCLFAHKDSNLDKSDNRQIRKYSM